MCVDAGVTEPGAGLAARAAERDVARRAHAVAAAAAAGDEEDDEGPIEVGGRTLRARGSTKRRYVDTHDSDSDGHGGGKGLTLVHFSTQLEPCLSHENTLHTLNTP
jgi:hypothetical protein